MGRAFAQTKTHSPKLVPHDPTGKSNKLAEVIGNLDDGLVNGSGSSPEGKETKPPW
jgi:hypothetical protein